MQPSSFNAASLIGNLAAFFVVVIAGAVAFDYVAGLIGMRSGLACKVLQPANVLAHMVAVALATVGVIVFVISNFTKPELLIGALIFGIMPSLLMHYLNVPGCGL
jgi:uncharacterized membrane protein